MRHRTPLRLASRCRVTCWRNESTAFLRSHERMAIRHSCWARGAAALFATIRYGPPVTSAVPWKAPLMERFRTSCSLLRTGRPTAESSVPSATRSHQRNVHVVFLVQAARRLARVPRWLPAFWGGMPERPKAASGIRSTRKQERNGLDKQLALDLPPLEPTAA